MPARDPARRPHDGSRTRIEARTALLGGDEDAEEFVTRCRRFTVFEITSGLADDSREADEKQVERRLRDLRARVKLARAVVSTTPDLAETLRGDWRKAARFYARFGISEAQFRHSVPSGSAFEEVDLSELVRSSVPSLDELQARKSAIFLNPGSDLYAAAPLH